MHQQAHWDPEADFSSVPFFIRRMDTSGYVKASEVPEARLPLISFIYVASGEVLVEADGAPFLCQSGEVFLFRYFPTPMLCDFWPGRSIKASGSMRGLS